MLLIIGEISIPIAVVNLSLHDKDQEICILVNNLLVNIIQLKPKEFHVVYMSKTQFFKLNILNSKFTSKMKGA